MSLPELPRQVIAVMLAVALCEERSFRGATYRGLRAVLGLRTDSGVRQAVRKAKQLRAVRVIHLPDGRGGKAVVRLAPQARDALAEAGLIPQQEQRP